MGIILVRTATLLLVATYTPEMSPSICVEAVEKLGELHNNLLQLITQCINMHSSAVPFMVSDRVINLVLKI